MTKDIYCSAPFVSRSYAPDGTLRPCCEWGSADDVKSSMQEDGMHSARQDMLLNRPNANCRVCYQTEQAGGDSMRMDFNQRYGRTSDVILRHLDFSLGNLCNFKCRMCNSLSSSKWAADSRLLGERRHPLYRRTSHDLDGIDLSMVDTIKFKGGETMMEQKTMLDVLRMVQQQVKDPSQLEVKFSTNGSQTIDASLLECLSACGSVNMTVSIDGIGRTNDYQRTGSRWSEIESNLLSWTDDLPGNFKMSIYTVWSLLNLHGAIDLMNWVHRWLPDSDHYGTVVYNPSQLGLRNMPETMKSHHVELLSNWTSLDHVFWVSQHKKMLLTEITHSPDVDAASVLAHITTLDALRHERFGDVDPYMHAALVESIC